MDRLLQGVPYAPIFWDHEIYELNQDRIEIYEPILYRTEKVWCASFEDRQAEMYECDSELAVACQKVNRRYRL